MKISIFTTITNPEIWQFAWQEALSNYLALADEVIVVNGGERLPEAIKTANKDKLIEVLMSWPDEWHWRELPLHLNAGLNACTGDWVIKMDIDQLFHEKDFEKIKELLVVAKANKYPAVAFVKLNILNQYYGFYKATHPFALNRDFIGKDKIQYGIAVDQETDWCYPIEVNGFDKENGIPVGKKLGPDKYLGVSSVDAVVYNYDYFFRTPDVAKKGFWRFAKAYNRTFGEGKWGSSEKEAWQLFLKDKASRLRDKSNYIAINSHPAAIADRIKRMSSLEYGYDNWAGLTKI